MAMQASIFSNSNKKFFCKNKDCEHKTFAETFSFFESKATKTNRLQDEILRVSLAQSSLSAERYLRNSVADVGKSTICNLLKKTRENNFTAVCIDDFALKKRQRYATVMIDIQTRKVVDMIESREMNEIKKRLDEYPNIQVVSRDGARAYATAITESHPKAIQISDRFHLLKNSNNRATLALQKIFQGRIAIPITDETQRYRTIMLIGTMAEKVHLLNLLRKNGHSKTEICAITSISEETVKKYLGKKEYDIQPPKQTTREREHVEAVEKLKQRAALVWQLHAEGFNITEITRRTGFIYNTVRNYLSEDFSPVNSHYGKQREGKLEPFRDEVLKLKAGGLKYREIHNIIKEKGYTGTQDAIRGFISKERRIRRDLISTVGGVSEFVDKKWLIRLLYQPIERLKGISQEQLDYVLSKHPL